MFINSLEPMYYASVYCIGIHMLGVTTSYKQVINMVDKLSKQNEVLLKKWISKGNASKFVGDNVRMKVVLDIRSNNHAQLMYMFSVFTANDRTKPPDHSGRCRSSKAKSSHSCQQDIVQVH